MDERRAFDCLDFKLMLTSLVDGTAPEEGRRTAERHALECPACLRLLEEAEATDFMLRLSARAEASELPEGFVESVLSKTQERELGLASGSSSGSARGSIRSWREGAGWLSAAAALAFAVALWVDRPGDGLGFVRLASAEPRISAPSFSGVRDLSENDRRRHEEQAALGGAAAGLLMQLAEMVDRVGSLDARDEAAVAALREEISREDLLARAALLRLTLAPDVRPWIQTSEAALISIASGCLDASQLEDLQQNLRRIGLAQRLREASQGLPRTMAAA